MARRKVKFGYAYRNGKITTEPREAATVRRIFELYESGLSFLKIANLLITEKVEFAPGEVLWNKGKIKRIIDDETYIGNDDYPPLISRETYEKANKTKIERDTQKCVDRTSTVYNLGIPTLCGGCGSKMRRKYDSRCAEKIRWVCENNECHKIICLDDDKLIFGITELLNTVIANPKIITETDKNGVISRETVKLENELNRLLKKQEINKEQACKQVFKIASLKYSNISANEYITEKLKADFNVRPLSAFSMQLFKHTVKAVTISSDGVKLTLKNGQMID